MTRKQGMAYLLCAAAVAVCAAAPAVFLRGVDAAYFGRQQTVADPYTAPTPTGKDYYLLRQLRARQTQRTAVEAEPAEAAPMRPQIYISQNAGYFGSMDWNADYKITVADALQSLADAGAIPQPWVDCALDWTDTESPDYTDYSGAYYPMNTVYYTFDSVGVLVLHRCMVLDGSVCTALSLTMDSRTGQVISVWISAPGEKDLPDADETALTAFAEQAGLASLGDWATRTDWSYTTALYSQNGGAVVAADHKPYETNGVERQYYSIALSLENP